MLTFENWTNALKYHWVEDDKEIVIFFGTKAQSLAFYKKNGGDKRGLHLFSCLASTEDGSPLPPPEVGKPLPF